MPEGISGASWAFSWGLTVASGILVGTILALIAPLPHRVIAGFMSFTAAVLLSAASISLKIATEAFIVAGAVFAAGGIIAGAAVFSIANAVLVSARHRKRCGECQPQPSEAEVPGSGVSIAIGTALDVVPKALLLGVTLLVSGPEVAMVILALTLSNVSEALSATLGMRLASRSRTYVVSLWSGVALGTAFMTALVFYLLSHLEPDLTAILKAFGAGALIATAAETVIPEAFHNGPRYSGVLAGAGLASLLLLREVIK
jgi:ZIP family zinc transporter